MKLIVYMWLSLTMGSFLSAMDLKNIDFEKEFSYLQSKSDMFFASASLPKSLPTANRMNSLVANAQDKKNVKKQIMEDARNTVVLIDPRVLNALENYFNAKKESGTNAEKKLYSGMNFPLFIYRLIRNRPLSFISNYDSTFLRPTWAMQYATFNKFKLNPSNPNNYYSPNAISFFTQANQNFEVLTDYLCYSEIALAALIGLSSPTFFINKGNRDNFARPETQDSYESRGIYKGLVGARFEQPNYMEWRYIIIADSDNDQDDSSEKNIEDNLNFWQELYGIPFLTDEEIKKLSPAEYNKRFFKYTNKTPTYYGKKEKNYHFDKDVYRKRMEFPISDFLTNTTNGAGLQKVYGHVVGLGLGVWALNDEEQAKCILEVFAEKIQNDKSGDFSHISDLDFSWFPDAVQEINVMENGEKRTIKNGEKLGHITIHFSKRNPADKLTGDDEGKLLVAMYAWDGGSYIGNEYWITRLNASGDPAAACCSLIGELQNPLINGHYIFMSILSTIAKYQPDKAQEMRTLMATTHAQYIAEIQKQDTAKPIEPTKSPVTPPQVTNVINPNKEKQADEENARRRKIAQMKTANDLRKQQVNQELQKTTSSSWGGSFFSQPRKPNTTNTPVQPVEVKPAPEKPQSPSGPTLWTQITSGFSSITSSIGSVFSYVGSGIWNTISNWFTRK